MGLVLHHLGKMQEAASSNWTLSGNDIYNNNSGNVGIGTSSPSTKLHVQGSSIIANSTTIDPDSYANKVVAGGNCRWQRSKGINKKLFSNAGAGNYIYRHKYYR